MSRFELPFRPRRNRKSPVIRDAVRAKEAGKVRLEGRDYPVVDGDVILFFHN